MRRSVFKLEQLVQWQELDIGLRMGRQANFPSRKVPKKAVKISYPLISKLAGLQEPT